jgi:7-cyano-7-deazaguanine synthase
MVTFAYGQRAKREVERARYFSKTLGAKDHKIVDISFMKTLYGKSNALTDANQELTENFDRSLVVPIRNAVFITIASAWAMSIGAKAVAYGAHAGDAANYPDCRPEFAKLLAATLNLAESDSIAAGVSQGIEILSPALANYDKSTLLKEGREILGDKIFRTWSCYSNGKKSGREFVHCGNCESCINRKNAFIRANIQDKTGYAKENRSKRRSGSKA